MYKSLSRKQHFDIFQILHSFLFQVLFRYPLPAAPVLIMRIVITISRLAYSLGWRPAKGDMSRPASLREIRRTQASHGRWTSAIDRDLVKRSKSLKIEGKVPLHQWHKTARLAPSRNDHSTLQKEPKRRHDSMSQKANSVGTASKDSKAEAACPEYKVRSGRNLPCGKAETPGANDDLGTLDVWLFCVISVRVCS